MRHTVTNMSRSGGRRAQHAGRKPALHDTEVADVGSTRHATPKEGSIVKSRCWCDRSFVDVPLDVVQEFRTVSCGRAKCKEPT